MASIPCCRLFSILPRSSWEPARVCIPETCAHSCAELPLPPSRQCEQPATSQVQATLLPSGCPCPNRALAAQQARHHSIISPESSCGPLKVDAVEPMPRAPARYCHLWPCHWCCCAAGSGQPAGQPRAPCGPRVSPAQPHTGLYQSPALSAKRTGVTVRRAACGKTAS